MTRYRRGETDAWQEVAAAALAALAGAATFYLARLWLRKEAIPGSARADREESAEAPSASTRATRRGTGPR